MLSFTSHALRRMAQRGLSESDVEFAHAHPLGPTTPGNRPDTRRFTGRLPSGAVLEIVVAATDRRRIISVWPR